MDISPEVALSTLRAAHRAAQDASAIMDMGVEFKDYQSIQEGAEVLTAVISDTVYILENIDPKFSLGSARKGAGPSLPEERLEILKEAVAIDELALESLLKTRMDISSDQEKLLLEQFYRLLGAIKLRVESTKRILSENWPGFWGSAEDLFFSRYLKKPKNR